MLRMANAAQSMYEISTHASMYIPMSIPSRLPSYVRLDRNSLWHTSALLSTAWETLTLPSRLHASHGKRGFLDNLAAAVNVNGNQSIAHVRTSVPDPSTPVRKPPGGKLHDNRMRGSYRRGQLGEDERPASDAGLDMDLFDGEGPAAGALGVQRKKRNHVFGQVESFRGNMRGAADDDDQEDGYTRKRRRLAGLPLIAK